MGVELVAYEDPVLIRAQIYSFLNMRSKLILLSCVFYRWGDLIRFYQLFF